jgi:hypothetical protein
MSVLDKFTKQADAAAEESEREERARAVRREAKRLLGLERLRSRGTDLAARRAKAFEAEAKSARAELRDRLGKDVAERLELGHYYTLIATQREGEFVALSDVAASGAGVSVDIANARQRVRRAGYAIHGGGEKDFSGITPEGILRRGLTIVAVDPGS